MMVDGFNNALQEVNAYAAEPDKNPYKQSFYCTATTFKTEREAQRNIYPYTGRYWKVIVSYRNKKINFCAGRKFK